MISEEFNLFFEPLELKFGKDIIFKSKTEKNSYIEVHPEYIYQVISFLKETPFNFDFLDSLTAVDLMNHNGAEILRNEVPWFDWYPKPGNSEEEKTPDNEGSEESNEKEIRQVRLFMLVYHLFSFRLKKPVIIKAIIPATNLKIKSIDPLFGNANWLEREVWDLFGIDFSGSRDLRRIMLPEDWQGFPLRKDYVQEPIYHGMSTNRPDPMEKLTELSIRKDND